MYIFFSKPTDSASLRSCRLLVVLAATMSQAVKLLDGLDNQVKKEKPKAQPEERKEAKDETNDLPPLPRQSTPPIPKTQLDWQVIFRRYRSKRDKYTLPWEFILAPQLESLLKTDEIKQTAIIDLRSHDFIGGNIPGCTNIEYEDFKPTLLDIMVKNASKKNIIFHCMYSQCRGIKTANFYGKGPHLRFLALLFYFCSFVSFILLYTAKNSEGGNY